MTPEEITQLLGDGGGLLLLGWIIKIGQDTLKKWSTLADLQVRYLTAQLDNHDEQTKAREELAENVAQIREVMSSSIAN